jgi:hypothetical protein
VGGERNSMVCWRHRQEGGEKGGMVLIGGVWRGAWALAVLATRRHGRKNRHRAWMRNSQPRARHPSSQTPRARELWRRRSTKRRDKKIEKTVFTKKKPDSFLRRGGEGPVSVPAATHLARALALGGRRRVLLGVDEPRRLAHAARAGASLRSVHDDGYLTFPPLSFLLSLEIYFFLRVEGE